MRKLYKKIEKENGTIEIYGSGKWIKIDYAKPEWSDGEVEQYFRYRNNRYYLSEIMAVHNPIHNPNPSDWMKEFDGYANDSFFSGILIKLSDDGEAVKAYTYIS